MTHSVLTGHKGDSNSLKNLNFRNVKPVAVRGGYSSNGQKDKLPSTTKCAQTVTK